MSDEYSTSSPGPGVDATGTPVVDPTRNVLDLVTAAIRRQDDLREAQAQHLREILALRSEHVRDLRLAESTRIDAIRAVDVGAVQQAAQVAATQATTLAAQVALSAETLRTQVAAAASAATIALAAALEPVQKDISELRRAQYEGIGQKIQATETRSNTGQSAYIIFGILGLLLTILLIAVTIYALTK